MALHVVRFQILSIKVSVLLAKVTVSAFDEGFAEFLADSCRKLHYLFGSKTFVEFGSTVRICRTFCGSKCVVSFEVLCVLCLRFVAYLSVGLYL